MMDIALASQSPRRRELLESAGYRVHLFPVKVSEIFDENLTPDKVVSHLATVKWRAALEQHKELNSKGFLILTGDTIVVLEGRVLGKPENTHQAQEFLRLLSGKTHSVMSGLLLAQSGATKFWTGVDETKVEFRPLTDSEIVDYIDSGEPMDKAGAYAIQGLGGKFVSSFSGSKSNVIGLPMELLARAIKENGWNVRCKST